VKLEAAVLIAVEEQLLRGEIRREAIPLLLEAVRHLQRCRFRRDSSAASTERRGERRGRPPNKKGHGRHGVEDYTGAERVVVRHEALAPGDPCPDKGCAGKLYDTKTPAKDVVLRAAPPVEGTIYEQQVLRCSSCLQTFTAPLPHGVSPTKYDPSVDAVLSVMRYALGMPHHRLEQWQAWAGVPLPASSQFERVEAMANAVLPVFRCLEQLAADRPVLLSDDTGARILSLLAENRTRGPSERTGIFTTGLVARGLDDSSPPIVLYASGRRHAGENVDRLLRLRAARRGMPIHMADASSMAPRSERIGAHCLTHARRYFFEASAAFPEQCARVLDDFAVIYRNDAATEGMSPQERLDYHRQYSREVMDALYGWMEQQFAERLVEPNGRLGRAISYLKNHWAGLTRFLDVPGVPLDNNQTERELKPAQRHRKNSLFFLNEAGAAVGDVLLSVIRTCTANRVDPVRYLTTVATCAKAVARMPAAWLPWSYPKSPAALS
jgi:transposase